MNAVERHLDWEQAVGIAEGRVTSEHAHQCPACSGVVETARRLLDGIQYRSQGLESEAIGRVVQFALAENPEERMDEWQAEVAWAREEAQRSDEKVPPTLVDPFRSAIRQILRHFEAVLVGDTLAASSAGVRGSSASGNRVLVYETMSHSVSVSMHEGMDPGDPAIDLSGQLVPKEGALPAGTLVWLDLVDGSREAAEVDAFGQFEFYDLSGQPSQVTLLVQEDLVHIDLPAVK